MVTSRVILFEFTNPFQELLRSPLLKHSHQRRAQGLVGIRGDLGHVGLAAVALLDVAASNLLELKVSRNIGGNQDVCQITVGHQKLRDQVDVPVVDSPVFLPRLLTGANIAVLLEQLRGRSVKNRTNKLDIHTVSMLTDAASLKPLSVVSRGDAAGSSALYLPSVVVIAIDVKDLVSLDTQDTRSNNSEKQAQ